MTSPLSKRERVWMAIRIHRDAIPASEVAAEAEAPIAYVQSFFTQLVLAGWARRNGPNEILLTKVHPPPRPPIFSRKTVVKDGKQCTVYTAKDPRVTEETLAQKMWTAIRAAKGKKFDLDDLALTAETTSDRARLFVHRLRHAGIVERLEERPAAAHVNARRWRLVKDVGPLAPQFDRDSKLIERKAK